MSSARPRTIAALVAALVWLGTTASYGATPTEEGTAVGLGGAPLPAGGVGSTDRNRPTQLEPGLWRDTLGSTTGREDIHYFEYRRAIIDSTVHLGVVASSTDPDSDGVGISVVAGPEETDCGSDVQSASGGTTQAPFGTAVSVGPDEPGQREDACLTADTLQIQVDRAYSSSETDLPIAIKVVEEAPAVADGLTELPPPAEELRYDVPEDAAASEVEPGASFDDAPVLEPGPDGVALELEVAEGQVGLVRVPVTWGQQVVAAARVPAMEETQDAVGIASFAVDLRIVEPDRDLVTDSAPEESNSGYHGGEPLRLSVGTSPLRYLNRFDGVAPTLPGDHWVVVAVEPAPEDRDPIAVPIELTVAVLGEPEGAPPYQPSVFAQEDRTALAGYDPAMPYLVGDDEFAAVASGSPAPSAETDDSWWGPRRFAGLGLGALSLALCAVGARQLLTRRPR